MSKYDTKWYNDQHAKRVHAAMQEELSRVIASMCPGHELSHFGINRDPHTDEVRIMLHLNPIGSVRVVSDGEQFGIVRWRAAQQSKGDSHG